MVCCFRIGLDCRLGCTIHKMLQPGIPARGCRRLLLSLLCIWQICKLLLLRAPHLIASEPLTAAVHCDFVLLLLLLLLACLFFIVLVALSPCLPCLPCWSFLTCLAVLPCLPLLFCLAHSLCCFAFSAFSECLFFFSCFSVFAFWACLSSSLCPLSSRLCAPLATRGRDAFARMRLSPKAQTRGSMPPQRHGATRGRTGLEPEKGSEAIAPIRWG